MNENKESKPRKKQQGIQFRLTINIYYLCYPFFFIYRAECNEICKLHKQRLESEVNKLRRDLNTYEDLKKSADQQNRNYEQEV